MRIHPSRASKRTLILVLSIIMLCVGTRCGNTPTVQTIPTSDGLKNINGTQLFYKKIGTGDPIFFLHGSSGSHRYFLPRMGKLADSHQLIFYDQRGTGLSDGKLELSDITIDQFVEDLEALRVIFGFEKISLIGHSWGAVIALAYALKYQAHLDRLILVDPRAVNNKFVVEFAKTFQQRVERLTHEEQQRLSTTCTRPSAELTADELAECNTLNAPIYFFDPAKAQLMVSTIDENTAENSDIVRSLLTADFNRVQQEFDEKLTTVHVPTLILHGDFDAIPIAASQYIQGRIPSSQLTVIKGSGHFPFVEQPEQFFRAIREFIQR